MYDYLIVGAGLFGSVCAHELNKKGKKVLVIEKRDHIAGNAYTENNDGIQVHKYGAHIFHTNDKKIWDYVNSFVEFNRFTNSPLANYEGVLYNLPFNMNTFYKLWGVKTPQEAMNIINDQRKELGDKEPDNLEEKAISLVGRDIYEKLIKGYTEKQWGRKATDLPAFIINRLPVRMTYDNNYFSDRYQGIPIGGYTKMVAAMLEGIDVMLNVDFLKDKTKYSQLANKIIYTGPVDEYFKYCFGKLEYRSLQFETEVLQEENYQGNAVINYTEANIPYTRIIEHKHFDPVNCSHTVVTKEFPAEWKKGDEPYYPINDTKNMDLFKKYKLLANEEKGIIFGGRLAEYKYYDMHQVIASALYAVESEGLV
ncbi:UDP-galactopyranose mutase [Scandinavium sp. V105_16]|uniref:UDP-galactopyranose mutase n=1 Tax=Scandinavium lactucae TaxID=3095028 RepID=A0AAJ2S6I5_9ENTR|nr:MULTISPECIES: UDP-galactopyranose mutase [unclassified Scandinavium]MDX6019719.1 UDP-galactopyranose mutase [Scandinavium sp. V105_16]MDX6032829.1 UDP-galactopyranose mutase [Scandinavium sp. V105_12]